MRPRRVLEVRVVAVRLGPFGTGEDALKPAELDIPLLEHGLRMRTEFKRWACHSGDLAVRFVRSSMGRRLAQGASPPRLEPPHGVEDPLARTVDRGGVLMQEPSPFLERRFTPGAGSRREPRGGADSLGRGARR